MHGDLFYEQIELSYNKIDSVNLGSWVLFVGEEKNIIMWN